MCNIEMALLVAESNLSKSKKCDDPALAMKILKNVLDDLVYISHEIKILGGNNIE